MAEQVFADPQRQLVVRLSDDRLQYLPAGQSGWQCRLADVAWTSSTPAPPPENGGTPGVAAVHLHRADGRIAVSIPAFDGIERFYSALLLRLLSRPHLDGIREELPPSMQLLERLLWLAVRVSPAEGAWIRVKHLRGTVAVATETSLHVTGPGEKEARRLEWHNLSGCRYRVTSPVFPDDVLRLYQGGGYVDLPIEDEDDPWIPFCARHASRLEGSDGPPYHVAGVEAADSELAMSYSWELEAARADGLLRASESVVACAFGTARPVLASGPDTAVEGGLVSALTDAGPDEPTPRTELILTSSRLLRVEREAATGRLLHASAMTHSRVREVRRLPGVLIVNDLALEIDALQPLDMLDDFSSRYRALVTQVFDPFEPELLEPEEEREPHRVLANTERLFMAGFLSEEEYARRRAEVLRPA